MQTSAPIFAKNISLITNDALTQNQMPTIKDHYENRGDKIPGLQIYGKSTRYIDHSFVNLSESALARNATKAENGFIRRAGKMKLLLSLTDVIFEQGEECNLTWT